MYLANVYGRMYSANFQLHEQYQLSGPRPAPKEQIVEVTIENLQKQKVAGMGD